MQLSLTASPASSCSSRFGLHKRDTQPVSGRACTSDTQCVQFRSDQIVRSSKHEKTSRLGEYACINGACRYTVQAGELCRTANDCAAFHTNQRLDLNVSSSSWCAPQFCSLESTCGGAWTLPGAPEDAPPDAESRRPVTNGTVTCCRGLPANSQCALISASVDTCGSGYACDSRNLCINQEPHQQQVWIGVLLVLVGGATLNIGLNLQKYAFRKHQSRLPVQETADDKDEDESPVPEPASPICRFRNKLQSLPIGSPYWAIGLVVFVLGNATNFIALQFAPQSLVAPLGAVALVTNVIIAPLLNNERIGLFDVGGIALIIAGCVIVVVFSGIVQQNLRLCMLIQLLRARPTVIYLCIISVAIAATYMFLWSIERALKRHESEDANLTIFNKWIRPVSPSSRYVRFGLPLAYASMGSLMAALTTLFAKSLVNLLSTSLFDHENQFTSFVPWCILLVTVFTAASQVYWINQGLLRYDALLQVPVFYVVWTVLDIIGGGIYFNEFKLFTTVKYVLFTLGVAVIFSGVGLLANRLKST
ncbi:hypothetical protein EV178_004736 [Coemansia sp. RSA 1646]|nr:hypothetical protein EV178_004736 [Coemansia sp. RSA 1646]KAJ2087692.1 hypothetical protein IW138_004813 [Coemansia sp. RSA 986]KAJ2212601.1 hypothetical protein EV179_004505 [Coemansia sp. RSA 487]